MKVAAIQLCSSDSVELNLSQVEKLVSEAARNGASVAVLPEMFALIGVTPEKLIQIKEVLGHGKIQDFLSALAMRNKIWLIAGTFPIQGETENKIKASCLVFNSEGKQIAHYNKIHLFDVLVGESEHYQESATTEAGKEVVVVDTPIGKVGLAVCYDLRFPELFRRLVKQGAEIIAIPAAFTATTGAAHWEVLTRARAIENLCYVVGACQEGRHANKRDTYGHSLVIDPWGRITTEATQTPSVIYADIDLEKQKQLRENFPVLKHQKLKT